jgi:outer membrane protein assembly factor BamB
MVLVGITGGIAAFDARTGNSRWKAAIWGGDTASFAGNIVTNNGLACIADYSGVGCVDMATGRVRWTRHEDHPTQDARSAIDATSLYYGAANHTVVARDLATGERRWATHVDSDTTLLTRVAGVVVRGDTVFATTARRLDHGGVGDLIALSRRTGQELWRYTGPSPSAFQGAPVLAGNLAILDDDGSLVAIDLTSRQEVWRTAVRSDGFITAETPPVLGGDTLFTGSRDTRLYAVDVSTRAIRWHVFRFRRSVVPFAYLRSQTIKVRKKTERRKSDFGAQVEVGRVLRAEPATPATGLHR